MYCSIVIEGNDRKSVAQQIVAGVATPTNIYLEKLSTMSNAEINAGNITACQTPVVLKRAAYEERKANRLSDDPIQELHLAKRSLDAGLGHKVEGYIQDIGLAPFSVSFYMEEQVQLFLDKCGRGKQAVLHIDATGSIISGVLHQGPAYYYSVVLADCNIPVLEFILTSHSATDICYELKKFLSTCRTYTHGSITQPALIVTDFSFAMMYAVLQAFNNMSLVAYLHCTFDVLNGFATELQINSLTFVALCCAHMMKAVSRRLVRCEKRKHVRQVTREQQSLKLSIGQPWVCSRVFIFLASVHEGGWPVLSLTIYSFHHSSS